MKREQLAVKEIRLELFDMEEVSLEKREQKKADQMGEFEMDWRFEMYPENLSEEELVQLNHL